MSDVSKDAREAYLSMNMLPGFDAVDVRAGLWDHTTGLQTFARFERDTIARHQAEQRGGEVVADRYRHKKRGTVYEVIGTAELQIADTSHTPDEGDHLTVYRGDDGKLWARPYDEFHDGRFEQVKP